MCLCVQKDNTILYLTNLNFIGALECEGLYLSIALKDKIEIYAVGASKAAVAAIEKAGGKIVIATAQPASGHEKR